VPDDPVARCLQRRVEGVKVDGAVAVAIARCGTAGTGLKLLPQRTQPCSSQDLIIAATIEPLCGIVQLMAQRRTLHDEQCSQAPCSRMAASAACGSA
jgi:hypothetical protein